MQKCLVILLGASLACAGPVDFGMAEFNSALAERNLKIKIKTELSLDPPETFRIETYVSGTPRVTGGDLRGLMYGLFEAADQIRSMGRLKIAHGTPATALRAVRMVLGPEDLNAEWVLSSQFWENYFQMLARSRFNRFNLVVPRPGEFEGLLRQASQIAASHGVDFTLGLTEPTGDGADLHQTLARLLSNCPLIRGFEMDAGPAPAALYRDGVFRTLKAAGRRVTLDLHQSAQRPELAHAASGMGLPLRLSSSTGPVGGGPEYYRELHDLSPHAEPDLVREQVVGLNLDGSVGFEIDVPAEFADAVFYATWGKLAYNPVPPEPPPAPARSKPAAVKPAPPAKSKRK